MKLNTFNAENVVQVRPQFPVLRLSTAASSFNKNACKLLSIGAGDSVTFHQDEESPSD